VVVETGRGTTCGRAGSNWLYARVVPSHAVELTSALLDRSVATMMARHRIGAATLQQKQDLAAVIHLCGAGPGDAYARRGFRLTARQNAATTTSPATSRR